MVNIFTQNRTEFIRGYCLKVTIYYKSSTELRIFDYIADTHGKYTNAHVLTLSCNYCNIMIYAGELMKKSTDTDNEAYLTFKYDGKFNIIHDCVLLYAKQNNKYK